MSKLGLGRRPWIVGHRGAAGEVRENTVASFERGVEAGADMIELDVQMSRDGELVCFHDWTLERWTGSSEVVEEMTLEALEALAEGPGRLPIPALHEALAAIPVRVPVNVELKRRGARRPAFARRVQAALEGRERILVSSFDWKLLAEVRKADAELPLAPIERHQPRELLEAGRALGAFSLHCHRRLATRHFVERAAADGFDRVLAYTVNEIQEAERLLATGLAGVFTDQPTLLVNHFKEAR